MSDIFAEATVKITPSLTGFVKDLDSELKTAMGKVKPPVIRVKAGLEIGFIGKLRDQVNDAVTRVQGQVKPIRVRVLIDTPSRRALQDIISQAPVSVPGVLGAVGAGAGERSLPAGLESRAGAGALLGLAAAEEKVTKARDRGTASSKKRQAAETDAAKSIRLVNQVKRESALIDIKSLLRSGELGQAQAALADSIRLANLADEARQLSVNQTTVDLQAAAHAERARREEIVRTLEAERAAAGSTGGRTAGDRAVSRARRVGAADLRTLVTGLRDAERAGGGLGTGIANLAAQQELLRKRTTLLNAALKLQKTALTSGSSTLQVAAANTVRFAEAQVAASKASIATIQGLQRQEAALAATRRRQDQANARAATAERRRSEQLSRGGQASILSLAGIRGATLAASRSFLVGAAAVTVFANAVRQFADLERNLHVFEATTSATHDEMVAVREEARLLGADLTLPSVTAEEAAGAMVELAKAGLSVADAMAAARSVLELATAAAIDNAEATRLVANVLNAFSLSGREAVNVADTLANAANAAQGSIADIGTAFQQAASAGRQVGLSFQDTAVFLTILAKNGIRGSDAGTSLRTALIRLINPSKNAKERFRELGISIHDAAGNLRPDVFLQIAAATREMAPAQRDATIALIGGQDAFRAVTILGRQSVESFIAMRRALREEGTAAELAAARTKGLHGSIDALQSVVETVGTTMASHLGPGIAGFVYQLGRGVTAMSESDRLATTLEESLQAMATAFDVVGVAIQSVGVVAIPAANALLAITNAISPTAILGGFVAFKTLNAVLDGAILRLKILKPLFAVIATARISSTILSGVGGAELAKVGEQMILPFTQVEKAALGLGPKISPLRVAIRGIGQAAVAAATSTAGLSLALGAATAAVVYFATRESEAERATRRFTEASKELGEALTEVQQTASAATISGRSVNAAQDAILEAKAAAAAAKRDLVNSAAEKGTFARTKQELALAIALDNVAIAEQRATEAERQAEVDKDAATAASERLQDARTKELKSIRDLIAAERRRGRFAAEGVDAGSLRGRALLGEVIAREAVIEKIREEASENRKSEDENLRLLGKRQQLFVQVAKAIDAFPDFTQKQIIFDFDLPSAAAAAQKLRDRFEKAGNLAGVAAMESVLLGLGVLPDRLKNFIDASVSPELREAMRNAGAGAGAGAGEEAARNFLAEFQAGLRRRAGRRAGLEIQEDLAVIGSAAASATLPVLQDQLALARADRAAAEAEIARLTAAGKTEGLAKAREARRAAIADERRLVEEIRGINETLANDAKAAADEAEQKQNEIFDNILKAMGLRRERQQQRIEDAEISESLADDIRQTQILRKIAKQQIENLKARIARARAQGKNVETLIEGLADLKDLWRDLGREIVSLQKQQRETLRDILFERFELRIQIAQSRGNVAAELRARRAKLEELTKELVRIRRQFGKNSIEWLRAKAAQVEEIAAIRELEGSTKEKNNALRELMFEFLTTQQGFAANLLGNLLPIGAIGNTVGARLAARDGGGLGGNLASPGGPRRPDGGAPFQGRPGMGGGSGVAAAAATAGAGVIAPPTRGQHATTNQLLNQILNVLRNSNQREKYPSSKRSEKKNQSLPHGIGGV